jgi:ubiquinone/menaquinone biosynthesis C-methylase UbiE
MAGTVNYDDRQFAVYAKGRAMSPAMRDRWMTVFASHVPPRRPLAVLDLGCGIGRFTPALADTFGGPVYGVEPSGRMRQIAVESAGHPAVRYLAGRTEAIPLRAGSCDVVLMCLVIHHVEDLAAGVAEISRVLRPGGRVLIRNTFADRMRDHWWYQFWPRAADIERDMFPSTGEVAAAFSPAGLEVRALAAVPERFAGSAAEFAARLRLRPFSTFEHLTEQEIAAGMAALDAAVASETEPHPIEGSSDLLVLGAPE